MTPPLILPCNTVFNDFQEFNKLGDSDISNIIKNRLKNCNTMVYAYDGTRRSYLIENTNFNSTNDVEKETLIDYDQYCKTAIKKLLYDLVMMFKHGIKTIIYPMWFCTLEERGPEYLPKFIKYLRGLNELLDNEELVQLYKENGIRVIFYGEYRELLERGNDLILLKKFEEIAELTKNHTNHTILFGTTIKEPSETIINNTISFYTKNQYKPTKKDLVENYYGLQVDDVSFYIGFDRFSTDGRPILLSDKGNEDLYYTVSPHSYFTKNNFRKILFDKLFCRSNVNAKEYKLKVIDVELMKDFYESNSTSIMGIGSVNPYGNYWYPLPQSILPINTRISNNIASTSNNFASATSNHNCVNSSTNPNNSCEQGPLIV
ncbi:hypothetical protein DICPUDRAFT_79732 [Dictyostelium purpureum]|uniref:Uncharacterized protein n=1 Tax=Dictyostelium purpureum TaxID=5786 RepID=F0ZNG2_DICPU|nr:uncharacterized protein DICPUDRAFT_79732 [Dictyostelium purpureum]EGC34510.1 hypothetical protein DICPUDRAFT_79732 [Dictyostelium purpureum]|eukprot:XP_003288946.1 hypothetical protein DICPUDRAFT_79732 [Dictyostelium purpureum]